MATVHDKTKPVPAARYDAVVEAQLARARGRIRSLDATVGVLGFLAGTLAYAAIMTLVDRWLELAPLTRQLVFAGYLLAAAVYLGFALILPLCRRLNPYYAAREVERSLPGAKNSVVNWLDLHDEPLPAAIHGALSQRAARDLAQVNLEQAISGRRAAWLGGAVAGLVLLLFVLMLLLSPKPFFSLLGRAFAPFRDGAIATRTQLVLLHPEAGDVTVPVDQSVAFAVAVYGRIPDPGQPDALKLHFRYQQSDPWEERPLERESDREWVVTIPAYQVENGFWYKITGGDDATPVHHVGVRSIPLLAGFDVHYHYRPYLRYPDLDTKDPNLRAHRGTEVTLTAHTNRAVQLKASRLDMEQKGGPKKVVLAEPVEGDPQALRFKFVLEADGSYRIQFTSTEGEVSNDLLPYRIQTLKDEKPEVKLTKPGQDVSLPANGMLPLEGEATDDIGLVGLTLRLKVANGEALAAKPYREGKDFKLADGGYPRMLGYKDFVELPKLKDAAGKPFAVRPKMVLEYWLEAVDNCDFPKGNVGESKHYKVTLTEPVAQDKQNQQQQQQQAAQDQKQHEAQQDEQIKKEEQERKDHPDQPPQAENGGEQKPADKQDPQNKDGPPQGGAGAPQQPDKPNPEQDKKDKDLERRAEQIQQDLENRNNEPNPQAKPDQPPDQRGDDKGDQKPPDEQPKDGDKGGQGPQQQKPEAGNGKAGQDQPDGGQNAGQPKDGGNEAGKQQPRPGQEKQQGQGNQGGDKGGEKKGGQPQQGEGAGEGKNGQGGEKGDSKKPGDLARINEGGGSGSKDRGRGFGKDQDGGGEGATKDDPRRLNRRGEEKDEGKDNSGSGEAKGSGKQGGDRGQQGGQAGAKSAGPKGQGDEAGKAGEAKAESGKGEGDTDKTDPKEAKKEDVDRLAKKAKGSKDRKERGKAEKKLDDIHQQANDPSVREAARKEMERLRRENEGQGISGQFKKAPGEEKDPMNGGEPCDCKNPGNNPGQAGAPKNAGGNGMDGDKEAQGAGQAKQDKGEGENGLAKGPGRREGNQNDQEQGAQPGGGQPGGPGGTDGDEKAQGERDPEHLKKAGELLLEKFRRLGPEDLKHLHIDPAEWAKFKRDYAEMIRRQASDPKQREKLAAPKQGGTLPTAKATEAARGTGKVDDVKAAGRGTAPPGYRDISRDFSKAISDTDKTPENK
jgi:collagen type III alpha